MIHIDVNLMAWGDSLLRTTARHLHIVARCSCIQWFQERA